MARFSNLNKVVAQRNAFSILASAQNESVLEMKTKEIGHGGLKHPFSQVEKKRIYKKSLSQYPFPKR